MKIFYKNSIKALDAMAKGLFASLIVGLLIQNFGRALDLEFLVNVGYIAQLAMGSAIALALAKIFNYKNITLYTSAVVGAIASGSFHAEISKIGDPLTSLIVSAIVLYILNKIENNRVFDILLIPFIGIILSGLLYIVIRPISLEILDFGTFISNASNLSLISVPITSLLFGFAITGPISSAALAIIMGISGKLAFVALVATSAQMSGFFIMCLKDNGFLNSLLILFGSSKLLLKNVALKPIIFVPTLIASLISGILAYYTTDLVSIKEAAGMGLLGFTGQILTLEEVGFTIMNFVIIIIYCIILPIIITTIVSYFFRKYQLINKGDLKL